MISISKACTYFLVFAAIFSIANAAVNWDTVSLQFWNGDKEENIRLAKAGLYSPIRDFNTFVNALFLPEDWIAKLYETFGENGGYYAATYLRDLVTGTLIYWIFATIWHLVLYVFFVDYFFHNEKRPIPTFAVRLDAAIIAQASVFIYVLLPVLSTFLMENNFTFIYFYKEEVGGWGMYWALLFVYMVFVEIGIYWAHRTLHTNKWLYKHLHSIHHKYNSANTLTSWTSIAFHPVDGAIQGCPYVIALLFIPCHYYTHVFLLFFTAVWATNIHDSMWGDTEPLMGSKYHLLHHTHYHYNYGQFFIFCDYFWGTLREPKRSLLNPVPVGSEASEDAKKLESFDNETDTKTMLSVGVVNSKKDE